ncbi:MAG: histidinol phosphatase, partial [Erysipelotrichaceae bacterium]
LRLYVDDAIAGMETGLYAYLCHPDLFMRAYQRWDDVAIAQSLRLCEAAKRLNIPLEYNLQGVFFKERYKDEFGYPYHPFWQLAATVGNQVMIGIDAHRNTEYEMVEYYERAQAYLNQLGVEVLTHLPQKQGR